MKIGKFFSFNGRSSGLEMAIIYIISGISAFISIKLADYTPNQELALVSVGAFFLFVTYMLIAVVVRRFHDMNMSGWNVMWAILPFILPQPDYLPRFIKSRQKTPSSSGAGMNAANYPDWSSRI